MRHKLNQAQAGRAGSNGALSIYMALLRQKKLIDSMIYDYN